MNKILLLVLALISFASAFSINEKMNAQFLGLKSALFGDKDCSIQLAAECAFDIDRTVRACSAAFDGEGTNIIADLKCAKDLMASKKHCWPCICYEAQKRGWKVIGC